MKNGWFRLFAVALALALIATACGGDDDDTDASDTPEDETTTEASVDATAFCEAIVEAESQVIAASQGSSDGDPIAALEEAQTTAPDELTEQIATLVEGSTTALEEKDQSFFQDPEFRTADEEVDQYVLDNCDVERVDVTAAEYSFTGIPSSVPSGLVGFNLTNEGEEIHQLILARLNDPSQTVEELLQLPEKEAEKAITNVGDMFALSGQSDVQTFELEPGTYGVVCFIPVGSTAEAEGDGPPHALQGMFAQFTVE